MNTLNKIESKKGAILKRIEAEKLFATQNYSIIGLSKAMGCTLSYAQLLVKHLLKDEVIKVHTDREKDARSGRTRILYTKYKNATSNGNIPAIITVADPIPDHCDIMKALFGRK